MKVHGLLLEGALWRCDEMADTNDNDRRRITIAILERLVDLVNHVGIAFDQEPSEAASVENREQLSARLRLIATGLRSIKVLVTQDSTDNLSEAGPQSGPIPDPCPTNIDRFGGLEQCRESTMANYHTKANYHTNRRPKGRLKVGVDIPSPDEIRELIAALAGRWRPVSAPIPSTPSDGPSRKPASAPCRCRRCW
jgi:hypothetical protein